MKLTRELADAADARGISAPYGGGGSTGYASGVAIVPGAMPPPQTLVNPPAPSSPPNVFIASAPGAGGSLPVLVAQPTSAPASSPCSTCRHNGTAPGATPGIVPTGGAYISPPGTGLVTDNFAPLPDHAPEPIGVDQGVAMIYGRPVSEWLWWIVAAVVLYELATNKQLRKP